ncbi:MAG TPA: hypothetical protein VKC63_05590 [Solirubrobacterales bacterium]|nr:hypothetical protein [Solirubrobacterales bacterium]
MAVEQQMPVTALTSRADRGDYRIRILEEAILELRGELPAAASGLTETVNRAFRFGFARGSEREDVLRETTEEALRLVEDLYGHEAMEEVRRRAV